MENSNLNEWLEKHKKRGGTRKIADVPFKSSCPSSEHNPPTNYLWQPGVYRHTCPLCGNIQTFTIYQRFTYNTWNF